jgi:hypothetical protein
VQPRVESASDRAPADSTDATADPGHHPASHSGDNMVTDPMCGMQVDTTTAAEHRQTERGPTVGHPPQPDHRRRGRGRPAWSAMRYHVPALETSPYGSMEQTSTVAPPLCR